MLFYRYIDGPVADLKVEDYDLEEEEDDEFKSRQYRPTSKLSLKKKYRAMSESLCDTLNDLGLVSFIPLDIQNKEVSSCIRNSMADLIVRTYSTARRQSFGSGGSS
jgi:hypothetical protein